MKSKYKFSPFIGCVEVEPIHSSSVIADDKPALLEMAKSLTDYNEIKKGDIIFFRPHGFFELPAYEGKKRYVVKVGQEFILGILHVAAK